MPTFEVTAPDGKTYHVDAPEGATEQQAIQFVQSQQRASAEPLKVTITPRSNQYTGAAEEGRANQSGLMAGVDTAVRGLARAVPIMDDIAAGGETIIGHGTGDTFGARYSDNLARQRALNAVDDRERPVASYAGQFAGAAALPVGAMAKAATLPAKIAAGSKVGAAYGAASGFGAGTDLQDRAERTAVGGGIGGFAGAVAAPVLAGAEKLVGPVINAGRGLIDPAKEAARRVLAAIQKAAAEGRTLTPEQLATAKAAESPLVMGDVAGERGRALARSSANTSPEGRETLQDVTGARFAEQSQRTASFINRLVGGEADPAKVTSWLQNRARKVNAPLYAKADQEAAQSAPGGLWGEPFAKLAESPTFAAAMRDSLPRGADRAVAAGQKPVKSPFAFDADGKVSLAENEAGDTATPTLAFWDNVKRELDAKVISLSRDGDKAGAGTVKALRSQLLNELDKAAPTYKLARGTAASFFRANDALEAGQNFVGMSKSADLAGARKALANMTSAERALFAHGYASELSATVSRIADNQNVPMRAVFNSTLARDKAVLALGPKRARDLQSFLTVERTMDKLRAALGNSTTARQLAEIGLAGGIGGAAGFIQGDTTTGGVVGTATYLARMLSGKVDRRVAQRVAELLASDDPKLLSQAQDMIANQPNLRNAFDWLDEQLVKIGGTVPQQ